MPTFKRQESQGTIIWSLSCILWASEMTKHVAMLFSLQIYSWSLLCQHLNNLWQNCIFLKSTKSFCQASSDCSPVSNEVAGVRAWTEVRQLQKSSNWKCDVQIYLFCYDCDSRVLKSWYQHITHRGSEYLLSKSETWTPSHIWWCDPSLQPAILEAGGYVWDPIELSFNSMGFYVGRSTPMVFHWFFPHAVHAWR